MNQNLNYINEDNLFKVIKSISNDEILYLEEKRKSILYNYIGITIFLAFPFLILLLLYATSPNNALTLIQVAIYLPLIYYCLFLYLNKRYTDITKNILIKKYLSPIQNIEYSRPYNNKNIKEYINNKELAKSCLFKLNNKSYIDEQYRGTYKNIKFCISEMSVSTFHGIVMTFDLPNYVATKAIIKAKEMNPKLLWTTLILVYIIGFIMLITSKNETLIKLILYCTIWVIPSVVLCVYIALKPKEEYTCDDISNMEKIQLEYTDFMKRFDVYSSNQVSARRIITPAFMKRFYDLETAFKSKKTSCSFYDTKFMITLETNKDLFEIGNIFTTLNNKKSTAKFYKELFTVYNMIEYFKLNLNIYTD